MSKAENSIFFIEIQTDFAKTIYTKNDPDIAYFVLSKFHGHRVLNFWDMIFLVKRCSVKNFSAIAL
jgi:hypothetical protein